MAKSRTLRNQLNECGAFEILNNLLDTKYNASVTGRRSAENLQLQGTALMSSMKEQSVGQWIASAVDTLQSQTSMTTTTSKELEGRESRTPTQGTSAGNIGSIAGSSTNLWNGLESSAVATSKAVFGVTPNMRRFSSDVPPS